jgi:hypothetical protein
MKPLIAAVATTFVLIQKVAKNQDNKQASLAPCRFFTLFSLLDTSYLTSHKKLNRHSRLRWPALVVRPCALYFQMSLRGGTTKQPRRVQ